MNDATAIYIQSKSDKYLVILCALEIGQQKLLKEKYEGQSKNNMYSKMTYRKNEESLNDARKL